MTQDTRLVLIAGAAVLGLIALIARFKWHSFIALTLVSICAGVASGHEPLSVARGFTEGMGSVLGSIAPVIGLGTILGKMLAESGGAELIALNFIGACGKRWAHWTVALAAFILGIPVFFSVGVVLLVPILVTLSKQSRTSILFYGLPLVAGLSVSHGLVPPHPGPIAAVALLNANVGKTIAYSLLVGFPTALICGPLIGSFLARFGPLDIAEREVDNDLRSAGTFKTLRLGLTLFTVLLPVLLMLGATLADLTFSPDNAARRWADLLGNPTVALLVAVLISFWSLGTLPGFNRARISKFSEDCLKPVASILLVVGAGGGFSRVLIDSGIGNVVAGMAKGFGLSSLVLGWLLAALIRVATGSSTVAITTTAGLLAPMAQTTSGSRELLVLAMGAGSLLLSHVNDGGFWIVKEFLNLSIIETLKTWSILETTISIVALLLILLLSLFLGPQ